MHRLQFTAGPLAGHRVEVTSVLVLGREAADLVIEDPQVSRRHASVRPAGDGLEIEDLESLNGTWVNGARVTGTVRLALGDQVRVGDSFFEVEAEATAVRAAPTEAGQAPAPAPPRRVQPTPATSGSAPSHGGDQAPDPDAALIRDGDRDRDRAGALLRHALASPAGAVLEEALEGAEVPPDRATDQEGHEGVGEAVEGAGVALDPDRDLGGVAPGVVEAVGDPHRERGTDRAHGQAGAGQLGDLVDVLDAAAQERGDPLDPAADIDRWFGEQPAERRPPIQRGSLAGSRR